MNSIMEGYYPIFEQYQSLRNQLMALLSDENLGYSPGGDNKTLGELCKEIGETQYAYVQSFKEFKQDFSYRNEESGLAGSLEMLSAWFEGMDGELKAVIEGLSEEDIQNRMIDRGGDFKLPVQIQLEVYKEALLIFYGKTSVYLKAMEKELPKQWREWIA